MAERPPRLAEKLFARLLSEKDRGPILGDLAEEYAERVARHGRRSARMWYRRQLFVSALPALWRRLSPPRIGFSWIDVKLGVRMLGKQPILTVVAGLTLALGIPAALIPTHMIAAFDGDLPVDEGDRVLGLRNRDLRSNRPNPRIVHDLAVWRETLESFESLGAARSDPYNVHSPDGRAAEVRGAEVTASVFPILRVPPLLGRTLLPADEVEGAPDVVVISEDLWESRFARDPEIVGKTIGIGRRPHTVVGVMPAGFYFPIRDHLWTPLRVDPADYAVGGGPDLLVLGRLADGVSREDAAAELATVGARLSAEWPETHAMLRSEAMSYPLMVLGDIEGIVGTWEYILLQTFCFALLTIACGNVGTLILARTAARLTEISVRTALGASRTRILSQLFAESLVLAVGATAVGLVLAQTLVEVFERTGVLNEDLPYWLDLGLTARSVFIALGLSAVSAVLAGVLPGIKATSPRIQRNLQANSRGASVRFGPFTTTLIVAEVALSVGFLGFGTAALLSYMQDRAGDSGLDLDRYLVTELRTPFVEPTAAEAATHATAFRARTADNHERLLASLAADPQVRHVAMGVNVPGASNPTRMATLDGANREAVPVQGARVHFDYFRDMGIDVLQGRTFTAADVEVEDRYQRRSVVVNDQFVRDVLGGGSAVGRLIRFTDLAPNEPDVAHEIVGVVETFGTNFLRRDRGAAVYHPLSAADVHPMSFIVEVDGNAAAFIPRVRSIAAEVDPDAIVETPRTLTELVARQRTEMRIVTLFVFILSAVGMLLAATGLYALTSFTVSQRTREIGIRTALGAEAKDVVLAVARRGLAQLLVGVAIGSVLGAWFVRANEGVLTVDSVPLLIAGVALAVIAFSVLSCLSPIRRGLRIQPTEALREV